MGRSYSVSPPTGTGRKYAAARRGAGRRAREGEGGREGGRSPDNNRVPSTSLPSTEYETRKNTVLQKQVPHLKDKVGP